MSADPIDYGRLDAGRNCNYWRLDPTLRAVAERAYPAGEYAWAESLLDEFGAACGHGIAERSERVDRHPPELHTYDADGEVANAVEYHPDQHETERVVYGDFRLTHDPFHPPPDRDERASLTHALTMQTLLCYADVGFACPASMTVGAALVLERADHDRETVFRRLTSADPEAHVEGAMFLTERQGGSDVGANETLAERVDADATIEDGGVAAGGDGERDAELAGDDVYELHGEKWFCSNVDAQGALVLARTPDAPDGTEGLSLFQVPSRVDGEPNGQLVRRLKDKLGTLSVPTGEVEYRGAVGYRLGAEGDGFRLMTEMLNYERLTNATGAVGLMGRALLEAKVRAANRETFGKRLDQHPLLRRDLSELTVEYEGAATFAFAAARQYNAWKRDDGGLDDGDPDPFKLTRLLVPVAKYRTAKESVRMASECMELLGGDGYVREHTTARLLRDAQVLPIWEGPSNVMALDLLRALDREHAHEALLPFVSALLDVEDDRLAPLATEVEQSFLSLQAALGRLATEGADYAQYHGKELADLVYDVTTAALLLDRADDALAGHGAETGPATGAGASTAPDVSTAADGDARLALVAAAFVDSHLRTHDARGVDSGATLGDDRFDALARYARVDPAVLESVALGGD